MSLEKKIWGWGAKDTFYDDSIRPKLWKYFAKFNVVKNPVPFVDLENIKLAAPNLNMDFLNKIKKELKADQVSDTDRDRLVHTYNQTYMDLFRLRNGIIEKSPDLVLYPENRKDVEIIIACANEFNVCVIPYGGGTNVARGTEPDKTEDRMIVVVDLGRMNRIISLDEKSRIARVEAGIIGKELEDKLNERGYTCGHDPDSIEFSTLGGWIASRSSGMVSNKYGDMADLLVSATIVTPIGTLAKAVVPSTSAGPDFNHLIAGSEGNFGIITDAVIHIFKLPKKKVFKSFLIPSFEVGVNIVEEFVEENCIPALVRVLDNDETSLSMNTTKKSGMIKSLLSKLIKIYISKIKKLDVSKSCLMFLKFEGDIDEIKYQWKKVKCICNKYKAVSLGSAPAKSWDEAKYDLAMLRDLVIKNGIITDASETATIWSNVMPLYNKTKEALNNAIKKYTPTAWVGCHISHVYRHGVCLYFLFAAPEKQDQEIQQYLDMKNAATSTFASQGGTVSHHHSVGQLHQPYLVDEITQTGIDVLHGLKNIFDPKCIMNPGKLISKK